MKTGIPSRSRRTWLAAAFSAVVLIAIVGCQRDSRAVPGTVEQPKAARGPFTVEQRVDQFAPAVATRLRPAFAAAGLAYPPRELAYLAFKDIDMLEVYGRDAASKPWRFVKRYAVLAASGVPGPKLREGDEQVPEGIYVGSYLNPNSRFHLSIRLNYPNEFDRAMARQEGRTQLGGDIMIHGNAVSIGCLAMGDTAAEDLFILSALAPVKTRIVVSPVDFRHREAGGTHSRPWVGQLYANLRAELRQFPSAR